jgi:hypothetical protein
MAAVSMPEATIHEDGCSVLWEDNVGLADDMLWMKAKSETCPVENLPHDYFWAGVLRSDSRHVSTAHFFGVNIGHQAALRLTPPCARAA